MELITKEKVRTIEELQNYINSTVEYTCEFPGKDVEYIIKKNGWTDLNNSEHGICYNDNMIMRFADKSHTTVTLITKQ